MSHRLTKGYAALIIILAVIIADQVLKFWVKTHFYLGESVEILPWFQLLFVENNGMAFGMEIGSKMFLSVFRVAVLIAGIWYLCKIRLNERFPMGFTVCIALIVAGAAGNIIDGIFYGVIFNNPMPPEVATLFPASGGYAPLLHGKVVDMLYFPLFTITWPDWMPMVGGEQFRFFQPVFNIADAAISVGTIVIVLFYSRYFGEPVSMPVAEESAGNDGGSDGDNTISQSHDEETD